MLARATWGPPRYIAVHQPVFLPKELELDELIVATCIKTSAFLLLLKETGVRSGKVQKLKWKDIDFKAACDQRSCRPNDSIRHVRVFFAASPSNEP